MLQQFKSASACTDCQLCEHGRPSEPGTSADGVDRIVQEVVRRVRQHTQAPLAVPVGVSARHCHLNQEAMDILFGPGSELTHYRDLYQPGAFAAGEVVSVVGPRLRAIERVRILGPLRDYNQVELARTDAIFLGLNPPVRDSGDLRGAQSITFIGPRGSITVPAAIRPTRHIHLSRENVRNLGLENYPSVRVRTSGEKSLVFENVRLKIDDSFIPEIHLDTDDANAADLACGDTVQIEI